MPAAIAGPNDLTVDAPGARRAGRDSLVIFVEDNQVWSLPYGAGDVLQASPTDNRHVGLDVGRIGS